MFIIIIIYMNKILAVMSPNYIRVSRWPFLYELCSRPPFASLSSSRSSRPQQEDTSSSFTTQTLRKHALRSRRGGSGPLPAQTGRIRKSFYGVLTNVQHGAGECQRL